MAGQRSVAGGAKAQLSLAERARSESRGKRGDLQGSFSDETLRAGEDRSIVCISLIHRWSIPWALRPMFAFHLAAAVVRVM